ncbi:DAN domain family member 5 [Hoplias malabaricus]|uniref:DAN domain family member 5 n=1 Tax=Hoplias malabaricus TaxID=27720 RepID=UPI003462EE46
MTSVFSLVMFIALVVTPVHSFLHGSFGFKPRDPESSGSGPEHPIRVSARLHKPGPFFLRQFSGSAGPQSQSRSRSKSPFPAFLALGRAGPSEPNRRQQSAQSMDMWRRNMRREEQQGVHLPLPISPRDINLKDQSCKAVPFTQRISEPGCEPLLLQNKLCFGHCASLFVPHAASSPGHMGAPCTRCGPLRTRSVLVHLRCGTHTREKRVMVVEECKCQTGREDGRAETTDTHL